MAGDAGSDAERMAGGPSELAEGDDNDGMECLLLLVAGCSRMLQFLPDKLQIDDGASDDGDALPKT